MNLTAKSTAAILAGLLLVVLGSYQLACHFIMKSASAYINASLPALMGHVTSPQQIDPGSFSGGGDKQQAKLKAFRAMLATMAPLGEVKIFSQLTLPEVSMNYEFPFVLDISVPFSTSATFTQGPVTVEGRVVRTHDGSWSYDHVYLRPDGVARKLLTQIQLDQIYRPTSILPPAGSGWSSDGPGGQGSLDFDFAGTLHAGGGGARFLDGHFQYSLDHDERMQDGSTSMYGLGLAIENDFRERVWPIFEEQIRQWRQASPQSGPAAIAEALYWYHYAWDARGGDRRAPPVSAAAVELYRERLHKAQQVLDESKPYASAYPLWYSTYMKVARDQGQAALIGPLFEEGRKRFPYFEGIYYEAVNMTLPEWGGSYAQEDVLIRSIADTTKPREGMGFYTRLYWHLDNQTDTSVDLFRDSKAQWPLMKQGFEDLMQRYPGSNWLLNKYAAYACQAKDMATLRTLLVQLDGKAQTEAWPSNHSYDLCKQIAGGGSSAAMP